MEGLSYAQAGVAVRSDLPEAHRRAWAALAAPGTWWSGAERVGLAAEVRAAADCALCRERKAARAPGAVGGSHEGRGELPAAAVEAAHRITTDPARLSRSWFEKLRADGLDDGRYVELVGIVVTVLSIDAFCRALGVPLHPLPEPRAGEPSRYRPAAARDEGAWVPMLPNATPQGAEADLWDTPRTGNVVRALSLVPDELRTLRMLSAAHYMTMRQLLDPSSSGGRALDRSQVELLAGRVSALNECFY